MASPSPLIRSDFSIFYEAGRAKIEKSHKLASLISKNGSTIASCILLIGIVGVVLASVKVAHSIPGSLLIAGACLTTVSWIALAHLQITAIKNYQKLQVSIEELYEKNLAQFNKSDFTQSKRNLDTIILKGYKADYVNYAFKQKNNTYKRFVARFLNHLYSREYRFYFSKDGEYDIPSSFVHGLKQSFSKDVKWAMLCEMYETCEFGIKDVVDRDKKFSLLTEALFGPPKESYERLDELAKKVRDNNNWFLNVMLPHQEYYRGHESEAAVMLPTIRNCHLLKQILTADKIAQAEQALQKLTQAERLEILQLAKNSHQTVHQMRLLKALAGILEMCPLEAKDSYFAQNFSRLKHRK